MNVMGLEDLNWRKLTEIRTSAADLVDVEPYKTRFQERARDDIRTLLDMVDSLVELAKTLAASEEELSDKNASLWRSYDKALTEAKLAMIERDELRSKLVLLEQAEKAAP